MKLPIVGFRPASHCLPHRPSSFAFVLPLTTWPFSFCLLLWELLGRRRTPCTNKFHLGGASTSLQRSRNARPFPACEFHAKLEVAFLGLICMFQPSIQEKVSAATRPLRKAAQDNQESGRSPEETLNNKSLSVAVSRSSGPTTPGLVP